MDEVKRTRETLDEDEADRDENLERDSRIPDRVATLQTLADTRDLVTKRPNANLLSVVRGFLPPSRDRWGDPSKEWTTVRKLSIPPSSYYEEYYNEAKEYMTEEANNNRLLEDPNITAGEMFKLSQRNNYLRGKLLDIENKMAVKKVKTNRDQVRYLFEDSDDDEYTKFDTEKILAQLYKKPKIKDHDIYGPHEKSPYEIGGSRKSRCKSRRKLCYKSRRKSRRFV